MSRLVQCPNCHVGLYWFLSADEVDLTGDVVDMGTGPPAPLVACPRCRTNVNTTSAYPAIDDFPLSFATLKQAYAGFCYEWQSHPETMDHGLRDISKPTDAEGALNSSEGRMWFQQRVFYRSAKSFYRALQLFLAFLQLEANCFVTWSEVTGYYCRFYFVQAFLNLILSTWIQEKQWFIYHDGGRIRCVRKKDLGPAIKSAPGSHEIWWRLLEAVKLPDYPVDQLDFIVTKLVFNPRQRNRANYDFAYLGGGFIELDWFDSGASQMMARFMPNPRADRDITNAERFFADVCPEDADPGDLYGDDAQILWCSLKGYLQLVKALGISQRLLISETIVALAEVHLHQVFPVILEGIVRSVCDILQDGFDIEQFLDVRRQHPNRRSSFWGI